MLERSKKIVDFYVKANQNKENIILSDDKRDYSVAEITVLACIDALARHSVYGRKDFDWDNAKVIRMILLDSLDGKMDNLKNKGNYDKLLEELRKGMSLESQIAKISAYRTVVRIPDKNNTINEFFNNYLKLRTTIRKGHIYWGAKGKRLESILEHIYGTMVIILGLESEYGYNLDYDKLLIMLLIHETEEIKIGDLTDWDISKEEKEKLGKKAVKDVFSLLKDGDYYCGIIDEFNDHQTVESKYGHLDDKVEYDLQVKMYELDQRYDFEKRPQNVVTTSSSVRKIIENGANSVFDVHYEYDKNRYSDTPCMKHILEVAKKM